jgi:hypothetical protein
MLTKKDKALMGRAMRSAKLASWEWDLTLNRFDCTASLYALFGLNQLMTEKLSMNALLKYCIDRDVFLYEISRLIAYCESFAESATKGKSKIIPFKTVRENNRSLS